MIIEQVEMENFGPYKGKHILRLGIGDHPLIVIHGQNMFGKTTIINAVRWGLYGVAKDRRGKPLPTRALINDDAFAEGSRLVSVALTVRVPDDQATYVLRRQHQARSGHSDARVDSDYEEHRDISRDGHVESPAFFDEAVASILPQGISRFFLFDGELLNEYEELVREGGQREARAVKEAIEMILGLPAARHGRDDVRTLREEVARRLRRAATDDQKAREAGKRLEDLASQKLRLESDQDDLEDQLKDARAEIRRLDESLKNFEEARADAGRREGLIAAGDSLTRRKEQAMDGRRSLVKEVWRDVLAPRLELESTRLDQERARRETAIAQTTEAQRALLSLSSSLKAGICEQCNQELPDEGRAKARAEIVHLEQRIEDLAPLADAERVRELSGVIRQLRKVAPAGKVDAIRMVEAELGRIQMDAYKNRQDLERVEQRLGSINTDEMLAYDADRRRFDKLAAQITSKLAAIREHLAELDTDTQRQQAIVLQNESPRFKRLSRELETLSGLEEIYALAVDELAAELRTEVQREASEIFLALTTDKSYGGLEINDTYGLTILRQDGSAAEQRSAGAEQVVALALLGALNRLATKRGPVIMDTPFGRLDRDHRANILRYLPTMADQVVLLVHDGEVDRERDLAEIRGQIDAEYRIEHPTSSSSSLVREEMQHG